MCLAVLPTRVRLPLYCLHGCVSLCLLLSLSVSLQLHGLVAEAGGFKESTGSGGEGFEAELLFIGYREIRCLDCLYEHGMLIWRQVQGSLQKAR